MRYLKLASAKNPDTDFIELNDLQGFLCTSFQTLGISRKLEFLSIKNRQFVVDNKPNFKKYSLVIEILSKYSEYEAKYAQFINFIDRNKISGFRLYYKPYDGMNLRYCLCSVENLSKGDKLQPIVLTLSQDSLWLGEEKQSTTANIIIDQENVFAFSKQNEIYELIDENGEDVEENRKYYYAVSFNEDKELENFYCVEFYTGISSKAEITNNSYNEIPLNVKIYGPCTNPSIRLFRNGDVSPIRTFKITTDVSNDYYIEIISNINENGVWYVNKLTGRKEDYTKYVNNEYGSPYFYIDNGEYVVEVEDKSGNICLASVFYQEEYNE